ncbi:MULTISPECIES: hypothetical protein [Streptomyces]|uniref:Uncharacterized protein n=1 Tax=Streptomyces venezuelae TaxID=54571 RepID=A0A5P2BII0_STRVZ|nr:MULTISPECIES: hypothetical protein [Streptomyces]NEA00188.1 hypothetical protein [Streptomyces sp. SID10116]MYY86694.1 hypothetical protein [Streptomyces sp. SID335]MYZ17730.1 hypothetical protein [Streptomyces sp. SID337]NDZ86614.1 hypothetical protein [Streptomyces sp. SID10115]NEB43193.1 hypothetical protein [Streptomyces sp. SID339]
MKTQVNIVAVVDVIGALSVKTLLDGNLCMVDDGAFDSAHQGTADLVTVVKPGQVVSWTALAVDLQTPVEIKNISFAPAGGRNGAAPSGPAMSPPGTQGTMTGGTHGQAHGQEESEGDKLDLDVWTGVVPHWMTPGVPYQYRLELQMYEGSNSVMSIDSPALMCQ